MAQAKLEEMVSNPNKLLEICTWVKGGWGCDGGVDDVRDGLACHGQSGANLKMELSRDHGGENDSGFSDAMDGLIFGR